ncbi:hypothetical protein [Archangium lansingense]|uniref:Zinc ribbon domain-containing protein n=1 Tax=Archangium lansingense TaxID=2995310 RepID=A0ABT4A356_9BACT|nr:hypothetical protein [Archangium lansinium]MCY1076028.1 hypothetical protein [Archangium lansinium]
MLLEETVSVLGRRVIARVEGGKFCSECGKPLAAAKVHCTQFGTEMNPTARFRGECGPPRGS